MHEELRQEVPRRGGQVPLSQRAHQGRLSQGGCSQARAQTCTVRRVMDCLILGPPTGVPASTAASAPVRTLTWHKHRPFLKAPFTQLSPGQLVSRKSASAERWQRTVELLRTWGVHTAAPAGTVLALRSLPACPTCVSGSVVEGLPVPTSREWSLETLDAEASNPSDGACCLQMGHPPGFARGALP